MTAFNCWCRCCLLQQIVICKENRDVMGEKEIARCLPNRTLISVYILLHTARCKSSRSSRSFRIRPWKKATVVPEIIPPHEIVFASMAHPLCSAGPSSPKPIHSPRNFVHQCSRLLFFRIWILILQRMNELKNHLRKLRRQP